MCVFLLLSVWLPLLCRFGLATLQEVQGWDPAEVVQKLIERASEPGKVYGGKLFDAEKIMLGFLLELDPTKRFNSGVVDNLKRMTCAHSMYRCVQDDK
jgi:hypothetical protein